MTYEKKAPQVQGTILEALPSQWVNKAVADGRLVRQSFNKNELIHLEGEPCSKIEIILRGEIVIERIGLSGDLMTINHFRRGDIIGANLIFSSTDHYPMTITATMLTEVISVSREILAELFAVHPDFMMAFIRNISDLSVLIGTKMKNRISRTIRQSIVVYLKKQSRLQETTTIRLTLSKKALAAMFGVSRTSLSRELQNMAQDGLIDYDAKTIRIIDASLLE